MEETADVPAADLVLDPVLEMLVEEGLLDASLAPQVMNIHVQTGNEIRDILVGEELIEARTYLDFIASQMDTKIIELREGDVPYETIIDLPSSTARMYGVVAIESTPTDLVLATSKLIDPGIQDEITFCLEKNISFVVAEEERIKEFIGKHYSDDTMENFFVDMDSPSGLPSGPVVEDITEASLTENSNSAPVVRFVNLVLFQAVQERASDVHFEPFETEFKIRIRVDGALYEMAPPPKHLATPIISRIKVMANLDIAEYRLPQDGRIEMMIKGNPIDFRVSTLPTAFGESVVLRVLDRGAIGLKLENLGMPDEIMEDFCIDIEKPNGIIIVTGPTGSGKTTTLYSALAKVNEPDVKLLTAEDPVEYDLPGIIQLQVDKKADSTFAKALRAFLRQDPDIIMVGEVRDKETCEIAIQAALTGHLVFTTLHTNDAAGAVTRLVDMDIEPFLIASAVEAIMGTRLVRRICSECKVSFTPTDEQLTSLAITREDVGDNPFYTGEGCSVCNETGYKGRRGLYEYLRVNDAIRRLINDREPTMVINQKARAMGMRTLREHGIRTILDGYTTVEEVLKYT